jgi:hypothetical protein
MNGSQFTKAVLRVGSALLGVLVVGWALLWVQLSVRFPAEHVYFEQLSPDAGKTARFSVKYQGLHPWLPVDIEPHCYVTVVDAEWGAVLVRVTEYHGDTEATFAELARKYAPWAVEGVVSRDLGSP